ncbi:unnamed protein product [Lymnaea stagnalis]|uniref:2',5'-phosphodiesterase 12 n=1 Tax=Lymnaea stagnalis TaxID=6523 RepID=A0AAV2HKS1_LYMST
MMTASTLRQIVSRSLNSLLVKSGLECRKVLTESRTISFPILTCKMSSVYVKNVENEDRLHISLELPNSKGTLKSFNLNRLKSEPLGVTMERLRLSLAKKLAKKPKQKNKKGNVEGETSACNKAEAVQVPEVEAEPEMSIEVIHNGQVLDTSISNQEAWVKGAVLKVGELEMPICFNPPSVKLQSLPSIILEGFPLFPVAEVEFADPKSCEFFWKTLEQKDLHKIRQGLVNDKVDLSCATMAQSFIPSSNDVGKLVMLVSIPKDGEKAYKMEAVISPNPVISSPGLCPFEKRHDFTMQRTSAGRQSFLSIAFHSFRVLTYNILAQIYADTDLARQELFNYCPSHALDMDYRKHLLLKEIIGYQADLLCLQEVDASIFSNQLTPAFRSLGYICLFRPKAGQVSEGCANFVREDKFHVVNEMDISLSEYLSTDQSCADIWMEVCKVQPLKEKIEQRSSVLQVTVVESSEISGKYVCLANTHLYFHPTACNIRLIHTAVALRYLQSIREAYLIEGKEISLVFCGDFNSAPHLGVFQLMTAQMIPTDHADWISAGKEEAFTSLELYQPINMESACGRPAYTNFTQGFQETLDYIFIDSDKLEVTSVVPMPSEEEVRAHVALPSIVFPSDHIAQICDLKFR